MQQQVSRACYLVSGANEQLEEPRRAEPKQANVQQIMMMMAEYQISAVTLSFSAVVPNK